MHICFDITFPKKSFQNFLTKLLGVGLFFGKQRIRVLQNNIYTFFQKKLPDGGLGGFCCSTAVDVIELPLLLLPLLLLQEGVMMALQSARKRLLKKKNKSLEQWFKFYIQLLNFAYKRLPNKAYENEVTMRGQNLPLNCCQSLELLTQLKMTLKKLRKFQPTNRHKKPILPMNMG